LTEFRWILLGIGLLMMAAIWWWMTRRSGQARGKADIAAPPVASGRNPGTTPAGTGGAGAFTPGTAAHGAAGEPPSGSPGSAASAAGETSEWEQASEWKVAREWGVPPLEPLSVKTARADRGSADLDLPVMTGGRAAAGDGGEPVLEMSADFEEISLDDDLPSIAARSAAPDAPAPAKVAPIAAAAAPAPAKPAPPAPPALAAAEVAREPPPAAAAAPERQRIVTMRVSAPGESRWPGAGLAAALEAHGLTFGRYQVFHRKHPDGRSLFCVASLVEPGTFDLARMPDEDYRGVTLFAVLPGPATPLQTLDAMLSTARDLAESLSGILQDGKGQPLSAQGTAALREDVARFQSSLP
jgi:cell division protein ZipA